MSRWHARSIRSKLVTFYTAAMIVVLVPYATASYLFVRSHLLSAADEELAGEADEAVLIMSQAVRSSGADPVKLAASLEGLEAVEDVYYELRSEADGVIYIGSMPGALRSLLAPPDRERSLYSVRAENGKRARVLDQRVLIEGRPFVFRVVTWESQRQATLSRLLGIHMAGLFAALALAGIGGNLLARRALAPVRLVTERARLLTVEKLKDGIPVLNPHDELGHLARTFNELFTKLDASLRRSREFSADASHELRTPLTAIRSVAEVGLGRDDQGKRQCLESILEEAEHMTKVVNGLLMLSRAEEHELSVSPKRMDLADLSREVVKQLGPVAEERAQDLRIDAASPVMVHADPLFVREALMNVIDNAIKHGRENAPIDVHVRQVGATGVVAVTDRGPGIPPADRRRVFDRFYRTDAARSRAMGGSGLGLAIAAWSVRANGGSIELESEEGRGSSFRIVLPAAT